MYTDSTNVTVCKAIRTRRFILVNEMSSELTHLLIVVQYSVHVLDPDSIDGSVKQNPLAIKCHVPRVLTERVRQHTLTTATHCRASNTYLLSKLGITTFGGLHQKFSV